MAGISRIHPHVPKHTGQPWGPRGGYPSSKSNPDKPSKIAPGHKESFHVPSKGEAPLHFGVLPKSYPIEINGPNGLEIKGFKI